MTRRRPTPHRARRLNLDPYALAQSVRDLPQADLEEHARQILAAFRSTAEAPGVRLVADQIAHHKPGSSAPRSTPMCPCRCPSQRDHWEKRLNIAVARDAERAIERDEQPPVFRQFRAELLQAAWDLESTRRAPRRPTDATEVETPSERDEWIVTAYVGMPAEVAAIMESRRTGFRIDERAMQRTRKANDRDPHTGEPIAPDDDSDRLGLARTLRAAGHPQSVIAERVGVAQSTVSRWLANDERNAA